VEGFACARDYNNVVDHCSNVIKNVFSSIAQYGDILIRKPSVADRVPRWPMPKIMASAINLDRKPCLSAEKVETIRAGRMLAPEFQACRAIAEFSPQEALWQAQPASQLSGVHDRGLWTCQHRRCPSTILWMVPLPVPGRNSTASIADLGVFL